MTKSALEALDYIAREVSYTEQSPGVHEYIEEKVEQIRRALTASGWQDISTAPKDGTDILLFIDRVGIKVAHWTCHRGKRPPRWAFGDGFLSLGVNITHWQPLPLPPEPEQGA